jgi:hypothetical protein
VEAAYASKSWILVVLEVGLLLRTKFAVPITPLPIAVAFIPDTMQFNRPGVDPAQFTVFSALVATELAATETLAISLVE